MKKIMVLAMALSLSVVTVSCKKGIEKIGNAMAKGGQNDANSIIDFNNDFLDSYKRTSDRIDNILKYADAAVAKAKGEKVSYIPTVIGGTDYSFSKIKGVPNGFDKDQKAIETDFQTYKSKKENIEKKLEELKSYMQAEDFKDDKGVKAEAIRKEIETDAQAFFIAGEGILDKIKPATDAAEDIILKDHPMKEFIISSKKMMNSLDSAYGVLGKQYDGKFNEAEAQKKYDEFAKAVETNSKMVFNVKDTQYAYKKSQFETVNKNAGSFLDVFRKVIRDAKSTGQISDANIQQIDSAYDSVLNSYNTFVK